MVESLVILALVLVISYFCIRTGRRGTGSAILVLVISPASNLLGVWTAPYLARLMGEPYQWRLLFLVLGLVVQGGLLGAISRRIQRPAARRTYLAICGGFTVATVFTAILRLIPQL